MIRAVLDTNIIISGLFWRGAPRSVLQAATVQAFTPLMTFDLTTELQSVLSRNKFAQLCETLEQTPEELVSDVKEIAEIITPGPVAIDAVRDPKDRIILACAVGGQADYIVSGDKDLLVLESFQEIPILNAAQFIQRLDDR